MAPLKNLVLFRNAARSTIKLQQPEEGYDWIAGVDSIPVSLMYWQTVKRIAVVASTLDKLGIQPRKSLHKCQCGCTPLVSDFIVLLTGSSRERLWAPSIVGCS